MASQSQAKLVVKGQYITPQSTVAYVQSLGQNIIKNINFTTADLQVILISTGRPAASSLTNTQVGWLTNSILGGYFYNNGIYIYNTACFRPEQVQYFNATQIGTIPYGGLVALTNPTKVDPKVANPSVLSSLPAVNIKYISTIALADFKQTDFLTKTLNNNVPGSGTYVSLCFSNAQVNALRANQLNTLYRLGNYPIYLNASQIPAISTIAIKNVTPPLDPLLLQSKVYDTGQFVASLLTADPANNQLKNLGAEALNVIGGDKFLPSQVPSLSLSIISSLSGEFLSAKAVDSTGKIPNSGVPISTCLSISLGNNQVSRLTAAQLSAMAASDAGLSLSAAQIPSISAAAIASTTPPLDPRALTARAYSSGIVNRFLATQLTADSTNNQLGALTATLLNTPDVIGYFNPIQTLPFSDAALGGLTAITLEALTHDPVGGLIHGSGPTLLSCLTLAAVTKLGAVAVAGFSQGDLLSPIGAIVNGVLVPGAGPTLINALTFQANTPPSQLNQIGWLTAAQLTTAILSCFDSAHIQAISDAAIQSFDPSQLQTPASDREPVAPKLSTSQFQLLSATQLNATRSVYFTRDQIGNITEEQSHGLDSGFVNGLMYMDPAAIAAAAAAAEAVAAAEAALALARDEWFALELTYLGMVEHCVNLYAAYQRALQMGNQQAAQDAFIAWQNALGVRQNVFEDYRQAGERMRQLMQALENAIRANAAAQAAAGAAPAAAGLGALAIAGLPGPTVSEMPKEEIENRLGDFTSAQVPYFSNDTISDLTIEQLRKPTADSTPANPITVLTSLKADQIQLLNEGAVKGLLISDLEAKTFGTSVGNGPVLLTCLTSTQILQLSQVAVSGLSAADCKLGTYNATTGPGTGPIVLACLNAREVGWLGQAAISGLSGADLQTKIASDAGTRHGTPGTGPTLVSQLTYPTSAAPGITNQVGWLSTQQLNELVASDGKSIPLLSLQAPNLSTAVFTSTHPFLSPYVLMAGVADTGVNLVQCLTSDQLAALTADLVNGTINGVPNTVQVANCMLESQIGYLSHPTVQGLTYATLTMQIPTVATAGDSMSVLSALTSPQVFWLTPTQLAELNSGDFSENSIGVKQSTVFIDSDRHDPYTAVKKFAVLQRSNLNVVVRDATPEGLLLVMTDHSTVNLLTNDTIVNLDGSGTSTVFVEDGEGHGTSTSATFNNSGNVHLLGTYQTIALNGPNTTVSLDSAETVNQTIFDYGGGGTINMYNNSWGHIFATGDTITANAGYFDLTGHDNRVLNPAFGDVLYLYGSRNTVQSAYASYVTTDDNGVQLTVRPDGSFLVQAIAGHDFIAAGGVSASQRKKLEVQSDMWLSTHH